MLSHSDGFTVWYESGGVVVGVLTYNADDDYKLGERLIVQRRPRPGTNALTSRFVVRRAGQPAVVQNDNGDDMLGQSESLDSDEVRNDDGDEVVDPPDEWIKADDNESLDEKLAAEIPDDPGVEPSSRDAHDSREGGALRLVTDDDLDHIDPADHGRDRGQIDGAPEDGDSFFNVES